MSKTADIWLVDFSNKTEVHSAFTALQDCYADAELEYKAEIAQLKEKIDALESPAKHETEAGYDFLRLANHLRNIYMRLARCIEVIGVGVFGEEFVLVDAGVTDDGGIWGYARTRNSSCTSRLRAYRIDGIVTEIAQ